MRYLFDIGHPAEVHYFKHVIRNLEKKGHRILVTARDKDVTLELLEKHAIETICTGRNIPSRFGKIFSLFRNDWRIFRVIRAFKPDLIVNFFSPFAAHAGRLARVPVMGFHDTEIAGISIRLSLPFTNTVVVPECYSRRLPEEKEIRFKGYFELCHLHPAYFSADPSIRVELGLEAEEKFVLTRFVSHHAVHDTGISGISLEMKREAVKRFSQVCRVFISSEDPLPPDLKRFRLSTPVEKIHHVMGQASLCFGESATMSAESAVLGVPSVFVDQQGRGYTRDIEQRYGLITRFNPDHRGFQQAMEKGLDIIRAGEDDTWKRKRDQLLCEHIDVTAFMTGLIENYIGSARIL
jgi:predicted glycosyltransferase